MIIMTEDISCPSLPLYSNSPDGHACPWEPYFLYYVDSASGLDPSVSLSVLLNFPFFMATHNITQFPCHCCCTKESSKVLYYTSARNPILAFYFLLNVYIFKDNLYQNIRKTTLLRSNSVNTRPTYICDF